MRWLAIGLVGCALMPSSPRALPASAPQAPDVNGPRTNAVVRQIERLSDPRLAQEAAASLAELVSDLRPRISGNPSQDDLRAYCMAATATAGTLAAPHARLGTAQDLFDSARRTALELTDPPSLVEWVDFQASNYFVLEGDLPAADGALTRALETVAEGSTQELHLLRSLAEVRRQRGRWDEAEQVLVRMERRVDAMRPSGPAVQSFRHQMRAAVFGNRGQILLALGEADRTLALLEHEQREAELSQHPASIIAARFHHADLDLRVENHAQLLASMESTLAQCRGLDELAEYVPLATLYQATALCELEREHPEREKRAAGLLEEVLPRFDPAHRIRAELLLVDLALQAGDLQAATRWIGSVQVRISMNAPSRGDELALAEARVALGHGYEGEIMAPWLPSLERVIQRLLAEWELRPRRPGSLGFLQVSDHRRALGTLTRVAVAAHGDAKGAEIALGYWLQAQAKDSIGATLGAAPVELHEVRRALLPEGQGALVYLPSPGGTQLIALDRDGARHFELPSRQTLRESCAAFEAALPPFEAAQWGDAEQRARHAAALGDQGTQLAALLLPPEVRQQLATWTGVTVVGGELLGRVPFESLVLPSGLLMGQALALERLPSLPLGVHLACRPTPPPGTAKRLLLAAHLGPPLGEAQARRLTAAFAEPLVRRGSGVTIDWLRGADLFGHSIVHLMVRGSSSGPGPGLVLAPGEGGASSATPEDVAELRLNGLVILSVCGGARGPARLGDDDLTRLGAAFLTAGARAVVLARAEIGFDATMDLMERFHQRLAKGDAPAEALRSAKASASDESNPLEAFEHARIGVFGLGR
jgi:hypothetical protein